MAAPHVYANKQIPIIKAAVRLPAANDNMRVFCINLPAYYFYVELEGQAQQPQTGELLARLREICSTIRLLGVYTI